MKDGTLVAKLTTLDMNLEAEMLDKTTKDSSAWKQFQRGNRSFSLSCEGFVCDPFDKNMILFSEDFLNAYWVVTDGTKDPDLYAAPDGFIKANKISLDATTGSITAGLGFNSAPSTSYTLSFWLKDATLDIEFGDGTVTQTATFTGTGSWVRYSITFTAGAGGSEIVLSLLNTDIISYDAMLFGAQVNTGATAADYEPTGVRYEELFNLLKDGTGFTALITDQTTGNVEYEGEALVNSLSRTSNQGQLQTFSCEITGNGELLPNTI